MLGTVDYRLCSEEKSKCQHQKQAWDGVSGSRSSDEAQRRTDAGKPIGAGVPCRNGGSSARRPVVATAATATTPSGEGTRSAAVTTPGGEGGEKGQLLEQHYSHSSRPRIARRELGASVLGGKLRGE